MKTADAQSTATVMGQMTHFLARFAQDQRGSTAIEYGLIAVLIVGALIGGLSSFADADKNMWTAVAVKVGTVVSGAFSK